MKFHVMRQQPSGEYVTVATVHLPILLQEDRDRLKPGDVLAPAMTDEELRLALVSAIPYHRNDGPKKEGA